MQLNNDDSSAWTTQPATGLHDPVFKATLELVHRTEVRLG